MEDRSRKELFFEYKDFKFEEKRLYLRYKLRFFEQRTQIYPSFKILSNTLAETSKETKDLIFSSFEEYLKTPNTNVNRTQYDTIMSSLKKREPRIISINTNSPTIFITAFMEVFDVLYNIANLIATAVAVKDILSYLKKKLGRKKNTDVEIEMSVIEPQEIDIILTKSWDNNKIIHIEPKKKDFFPEPNENFTIFYAKNKKIEPLETKVVEAKIRSIRNQIGEFAREYDQLKENDIITFQRLDYHNYIIKAIKVTQK